MAQATELRDVLHKHLHDPSSSFSIGSFGAIAEFHRDADEPLLLDDPERLTIATTRGGLRIDLATAPTPLAYETLSGRAGRWQQGVVFCLAEALATSHCRSVLTELGPDREAIQAEDRNAILFDMGLSARNVDFCIRTKDPTLLSRLRQAVGRSVLEPENSVMATIVEASPHRIAISKLGRAEVYQAIAKVKTPEGPHTHVLPKLLRSNRTHSANIPVAKGYLPALSLYPANPLYDSLGRQQAFQSTAFAAFEDLLASWGLPEYRAEKERIRDALQRGEAPATYRRPTTRLGRTALRVALRQSRQVNADKPLVAAWSKHFDAPKSDGSGLREA